MAATVHWVGPTVRAQGLHVDGEGIQRFHMDSNGRADAAYHALVCPQGYVFEGPGT